MGIFTQYIVEWPKERDKDEVSLLFKIRTGILVALSLLLGLPFYLFFSLFSIISDAPNIISFIFFFIIMNSIIVFKSLKYLYKSKVALYLYLLSQLLLLITIVFFAIIFIIEIGLGLFTLNFIFLSLLSTVLYFINFREALSISRGTTSMSVK